MALSQEQIEKRIESYLAIHHEQDKKGVYIDTQLRAIAFMKYKQSIEDHREQVIKTVLEYNLSGMYTLSFFRTSNDQLEYNESLIIKYWGNLESFREYLLEIFGHLKSEYQKHRNDEAIAKFFNPKSAFSSEVNPIMRLTSLVHSLIWLYSLHFGQRQASRTFDLPIFDVINKINDEGVVSVDGVYHPDPQVYSQRFTEKFLSRDSSWRNYILFLEPNIRLLFYHDLEGENDGSAVINTALDVMGVKFKEKHLNLILSFGSIDNNRVQRIEGTTAELHVDDNANLLVNWPTAPESKVIDALCKNRIQLDIYGERKDPMFMLADDEMAPHDHPIVFQVVLRKCAKKIATPVLDDNYQADHYGFTSDEDWANWKSSLKELHPIPEDVELSEYMSDQLRKYYSFQDNLLVNVTYGHPIYEFDLKD